MGGIPLPALAVHPPQQQDMGEQVGRLIQMKSLMNQQQAQQQEMQLRQQQINDQQATTAAMKQWDGKDYDALAHSVLQNGGSANAATAIQQHGLAIKKTVSDIAAQDAKTGSTNLETFQKKHEMIGDALKGLEAIPDDQIHQATIDKIGELSQGGVFDQQTAQGLVQKVQQVPDAQTLRGLLDQTAKASLGAKYVADQAKVTADTRKANAEALAKEKEAKWYDDNPQMGAPGVTPTAVQMRDWLKKNPGKSPADYPAAEAAQKAYAEAPVRIATARAEGEARANIEAQTARGSNAALATVPPHLVAPASAAATKAGEDYAQAQSVSQRLQAMMKDARDGNVVSYQLLPQEGALQVTTSQGVHRINMAEIQNYGGGSLWQRLQGHIGKQLTGQSIPESVLKDMEDMQRIQAEGSQKKYENTLKTVNQTYGSKFEPVQMEPMDRNVPSTPAVKHVAGGSSNGLQEGKTGTGSDGKKYVVKNGTWVPQQ